MKYIFASGISEREPLDILKPSHLKKKNIKIHLENGYMTKIHILQKDQ